LISTQILDVLIGVEGDHRSKQMIASSVLFVDTIFMKNDL